MTPPNLNAVIGLTIRIMPSGEELDVELPLYSTGKEIIDELLNQQVIPRNSPEGDPYVYKLASKSLGGELSQEKSLFDMNIRDKDTLLLTPRLVAGC
ncbi:MAG: hypothetical protein SF053_16110 [Bacteroidia bacterium]|nr:hypothetical protein [Bacteroidia bacterium]